jgi:hypothetical protein
VTTEGEPGDVGTASEKLSKEMALGPLLLTRTVTDTGLGQTVLVVPAVAVRLRGRCRLMGKAAGALSVVETVVSIWVLPIKAVWLT